VIADLHAHYPMHLVPAAYDMPWEIVSAIAAREGVIGLIFAQHQLLDGLPSQSAKTFC
jgi:hypothetical protein